jgi:hypothetical protein
MNWKCSIEGCEFIGKNTHSLTMHTTRKHKANWSGRPKRNLPAVRAKAPEVKTGWTELEGFTLLDDGKGGIWLAERIK